MYVALQFLSRRRKGHLFKSKASPYGLFGGQRDSGAGFFRVQLFSLSIFILSITPRSIIYHLRMAKWTPYNPTYEKLKSKFIRVLNLLSARQEDVWRSEGIDPHILKLGIRCRQKVSVTGRWLYQGETGS
jgi:hypothetical protein